MKRKRGIGKRKPKLTTSTMEGNPNTVNVNTRDEWDLDYCGNNEVNGTSELEHQPQMSNQQKSQLDLGNQKVVTAAVDDSTSSFPGLNMAASTSLLKKARSKMSNNAISSSSTKQISIAGNVQIRGTHQRGPELPNQDSEYKEKELKVALEVIRKVMKMDAAEPFNVPVDPVAQGIPDYFDIIDTPMDFGTICYNIECGVKYKNSEDVTKDVQYIWDNCCRYNRKGHFILELMKRVKKNFIKYWTEAGLCKEKQQEIDEDTHIPFSKPTTPYKTHENGSPLAALANCARSLQQDREDLASPQLDSPSLTCSESCKSHQRPRHYQEDTMRGNRHDYSVDPLDYDFAHIPIHPRQNSHEISNSHSSLWRSKPYQLQQRSRHSYLSHVQPPHTYHQDSAFISGAGHPRTTHRTESIARGSPGGRWCFESHHAGKKIHHQPEYHDHQSSLCCSWPYRPQRDFCPCFQCSGHAEGDFDWHLSEPRNSKCPMTDLINHRLQDQKAFSGLQKRQPSELCGVVDFESHRSGKWSVSYSKQLPSKSKCPMADFTSDLPHHRTDLSSTRKQQPSETCGDEEFISPPPTEPMVTVAMRCPPNYPVDSMTETITHKLLDELTPNQHSDKQLEPQMESCQAPSSSQSQSQSPPPQAPSNMIPAVSNNTKKKSRSRGPTRCLKVFETEDKIPITTNEDGEPIGDEAQKLITFLGVIARNGHLTPLNYVQWKQLPEENKEKMWQLIQSKFDINPKSKIWALKSLAKKWSSWKSLLKVNHYNPHETEEARLADCDERVLPDQWRILVQFWNSPEAQVVSDKNKANRAHLKFRHTTGTKSFARVREEQRLKRPDGKDPSEADLFILTRTRKNGQPVCETSSKIISELRDAAQQKHGTSKPDTIENEVFAQVLGEDRRKRKRGHAYGLGPAPSNTLPPEAEKIVLEAKAEVLEMKEKMVAVEQTCAQMAAQMAAMMSMMQKNFAATNTPNLDVSVHPEESEDVSSSHNGFQTLKVIQSSATKARENHSDGKVAHRKT